MWRPISSVSALLAEPLKSLKRRSSLRLRVRLRSAAGLASFAFEPASGCTASFTPPSRVVIETPSCCLSSDCYRSLFPLPSPRYLQAGWLWLHSRFLLQTLAGRLGFEPRQVPPKGTVLPLDDRPTSQISRSALDDTAFDSRSRVSLPQMTAVNPLLQKHFVPVLPARHRARQLTFNAGRTQPFLGRFCESAGQVQPEECRTGSGQRSMEGCLRGVRSRKKTLDFAKGGMLVEHDLFEVVMDPATDPGADKRGLLRSGQVLSTGKDTGGTNSLPTSRNCSRKGAGIGAAQLLEFSCTGLCSQTLSSTEFIPIAKRLRGRNSHLGT